jgi:DNA-3-methyladenine glycosylase I
VATGASPDLRLSRDRCPWARGDEAYHAYHDLEWGVPSHHDAHLFELLILEGAQAGLSWLTILRKRQAYRAAFARFDIRAVADLTPVDEQRLLLDPGIVRNRAKIAAAVINARAALRAIEAHGSLDAYLWRFVGGRPIQNRWRSLPDVPASTPISDAMSKTMKKDGFKFVGTTICYAFMQAVGMVNDHLVSCPRHAELSDA